MSDVDNTIIVRLDASQALGDLRQLQSRITEFNRAVITSNEAAVRKQSDLMSTLAGQINATKAFTTQVVNIESSVSKLGRTIDRGKLSLGQYFTYGAAASGKFNKMFGKQHAEIMQLATDRVQKLQTQYIALGESAGGMTKALAVRPLHLFNADATVAMQRTQIFNKLLRDGSTSLVNFGKNTQWAGRQLMVGFSIPLSILALTASKAFKDIENSLVSFKRVYGDAMTTDAETNAAAANMQKLAMEYTKYGIAVSDTITLGAKAAAAGYEGQKLQAQTAQATRLATLGQMDQNQALDTTISLMSAFNISAKDMGKTVDFINAVENQTVLSIEDLSTAIPAVAPVIKGLGGDVQDFAVMLTAMREGGVNAAEGANALKSGLASLINPTKAAKAMAESFGIDLNKMAEENKGNLMGMVTDFSKALNQLGQLDQEKLMAKLFGKYQFARMGAMFSNLAKSGSQAQRVIELTAASTETLAGIADKELSKVENAVNVKFTASIERLKAEIAPIGGMFMQAATPVINAVSGLVKGFNNLDPVVKNVIFGLTAGLGVVAPTVLMITGLFANLLGNIGKFGNMIRTAFAILTGRGQAFQYVENGALDAAAAAAALEGRVDGVTNSLNVQYAAVRELTAAYQAMWAAGQSAMSSIPAGFRKPATPVLKLSTGGTVPGTGTGDKVPALLEPREKVVNRTASMKYGPIIDAMNRGTLQGFKDGTPSTSSAYWMGKKYNINTWAGEKNVGAMDRFVREMQALALSAENVDRAMAHVTSVLEQLSSVVGKTSIRFGADLLEQADPKTFKTLIDRVAGTVTGGAAKPIRDASNKATWMTKGAETAMIDSTLKQISSNPQWNSLLGPKGYTEYSGINASHLTPQKAMNLKTGKINSLYDPENLTPDLRVVNNYLNRAQQIAQKGMNDTDFMNKMVKETGLTAQQVETELKAFAQGLHPVTQQALVALKGLATIDKAAVVEALGTAGATSKTQTAYGQSLGGSTQAMIMPGVIEARLAQGSSGVSSFQNAKSTYSGLGSFLRDTQVGPAGLSKATEAEARTYGIKLMNGVENGLLSAFQVHSPSTVINKLTKGILDGAVIGFTEGLAPLDDAVAAKAMEAVRKVQASPIGSMVNPANVNQSTQVSQALRNANETTVGRATAAAGGSKMLGTMNKVMFGLNGLAAALAFIPGPLQEFGSNVLMATIALQGFAALAQALGGGALIAKIGGFVAAAGGLIPALAAIAPVALPVVVGLGALAAIIWAVNEANQKAKENVNYLGEQARLSGDQIEGLRNSFGWEKQNNTFSTQTIVTGKGATDLSTATQAKQYIENPDNNLQTNIDAMSKASVADAKAYLRDVINQLISDGAPKETVTAIAEQMAIAAKKQEIYVPVKAEIDATVGDNGKIKDATKFLQDSTKGAIDRVMQGGVASVDEFNKKLQEAGVYNVELNKDLSNTEDVLAELQMRAGEPIGGLGSTPEMAEQALETQKAIIKLRDSMNSVAPNLKEIQTEGVIALTALNTQLSNGAITWDQYNAAIKAYGTTLVNSLGEEQALSMLKSQIAAIPKLGQAAADTVTNVSDAVLLLQAAGSGADMSTLINQLVSTGWNADDARGKLQAFIKAAMAAANVKTVSPTVAAKQGIKGLEARIKQIRSTQSSGGSGSGRGGGGSSTPKDPFAKREDALRDKQARITIKEIRIDRTLDSRFRKELADRFKNVKINIGGLNINLKTVEDAQYAITMIGEQIEDIQRGPLQEWEDKVDDLNDQMTKLQDEQDAINHQIELYQQEIDKINEAYNEQLKPLQEIKAEQQNILDNLQYEKEVATQALDEQITLLQNQKDIAEHVADAQIKLLDEQIDRNNDNKDLINQQVDAIDKQISALDDVAKANEYILNQQKSQLSLASALSAGDMGAAAQAMQEGRATASSDAISLQQAGFDKQKDVLSGQADNLDAQNAALEKRKNAIQDGVDALDDQIKSLEYQKTLIENNYDLQIQAIQAVIDEQDNLIANLEYQRDLETETWQALIDSYAPALRDLDNEIYDIQLQIKTIQEDQIKPLEDQIEALTRQKDLLDDIIGDTQTQLDRDKQALEARKKYLDQEQQILAAKKELADLDNKSGGGGGVGGGAGGSGTSAAELKKLEAQARAAKIALKALSGEKPTAKEMKAWSDWWKSLSPKDRKVLEKDPEFKAGIEKMKDLLTTKMTRASAEASTKTSRNWKNAFDTMGPLSDHGLENYKKNVEHTTDEVAGYLRKRPADGFNDAAIKMGKAFENWRKAKAGPEADKAKAKLKEIYDSKDWKRWTQGAWGKNKDAVNGVNSWFNQHFINPMNKVFSGVGVGGGLKKIAVARGGILPGFRGVTHGDDIPAMLRSGEGVTVSEALRNNPFEAQRLLALNKAALSGSLSSFYEQGYATGGVAGKKGKKKKSIEDPFKKTKDIAKKLGMPSQRKLYAGAGRLIDAKSATTIADESHDEIQKALNKKYGKGGYKFTADSGGVLRPGVNSVFNGTGKNETILTNEQSRAIAAAFSNFNLAGIPTYNVSTNSTRVSGASNQSPVVYNRYELSVVAKSEKSADDIADIVVTRIQDMSRGDVRSSSGFVSLP